MVKDVHFRVICIKTDSGLPLFVRSVGSIDQPPDPIVTSLNGIYSFCSSYGVKLIQTRAGEACISWKTFNKSLTLILETNDSSYHELHENILNLIFNSIILLLGTERLQQNGSFDKLKKDLQICYRLVDSLMTLNTQHLMSSVMTQAINSLSSPDLPSFQVQFDGYAMSVGTPLACFFIGGLLSASTSKFLKLPSIELVLLQLLVVTSMSSSSSSSSSSSPNIIETVVYLPESSPDKGLRLVLLNVVRDGVICLLCGERPVLSEIISKTKSYWSAKSDSQSNLNLSRGNLDLVQDFSRMVNKSLPLMKDINKDIVSFLLVNTSTHQCIICTDINKSDSSSKFERGRILKAFHQQTHKLFDRLTPVENTGQGISVPCSDERRHKTLTSYVCLETYKCYAFREDDREIYLVFNPSIPLFALRSVSKDFLSYLLTLKWFHM